MHVDDFIDNYRTDAYASFVLHFMRLPATNQIKFRAFTEKHKLFCSYDGKRYRVTSASRLGDVGISANFERDAGYDLRVDVEKCSQWAATERNTK